MQQWAGSQDYTYSTLLDFQEGGIVGPSNCRGWVREGGFPLGQPQKLKKGPDDSLISYICPLEETHFPCTVDWV